VVYSLWTYPTCSVPILRASWLVCHASEFRLIWSEQHCVKSGPSPLPRGRNRTCLQTAVGNCPVHKTTLKCYCYKCIRIYQTMQFTSPLPRIPRMRVISIHIPIDTTHLAAVMPPSASALSNWRWYLLYIVMKHVATQSMPVNFVQLVPWLVPLHYMCTPM